MNTYHPEATTSGVILENETKRICAKLRESTVESLEVSP